MVDINFKIISEDQLSTNIPQGEYISPLKDSPFKAPPSPSQMTPRSRQLYSFGEGVGVSYNDI
jgi:hypothetical protein